MKVSERTAQYEKLLSVSKSVIRECDAEAKRLRDIAINFRNIAEQYDAMAEETDKMKRTVPIADWVDVIRSLASSIAAKKGKRLKFLARAASAQRWTSFCTTVTTQTAFGNGAIRKF